MKRWKGSISVKNVQRKSSFCICQTGVGSHALISKSLYFLQMPSGHMVVWVGDRSRPSLAARLSMQLCKQDLHLKLFAATPRPPSTPAAEAD